MLEADLTLVTDAARAAGDIACGYFKADPKVWDKACGQGPVTEADLAVDRYLKETFETARPDYGWLSEESESDTPRLTRSTVFILDPIDGTRAFIAGKDTWAISIAIAHQGRPQVACVYLPVRDLMYTAHLGGGARLNGHPIHVTDTPLSARPSVLGAKWNFEPHHWPGGIPDVEPAFRSSLAYRLAAVAQGKFDAMLTLRPTWDWDIAAGSLIVTEAGGTATDRTGGSFVFNGPSAQQNGAVATNPKLHAQLLGKLTKAPA